MAKLDDLREEYPHISFRKSWELNPDITRLLGECFSIVLSISGMPITPEAQTYLKLVSLKKGAQATTAIEGNTLTDEEIDQIAEGEHLPPSKVYQEKEVFNILHAMNTLFSELLSESPKIITPDFLRRLHEMVGKDLGEYFDAIPGRFRTDRRVVGTAKLPSHHHIESLVDAYCRFLAEEFSYSSGKQQFEDAVIQAIVAHIYLEWIHPFGDGNGRTGRLLEFYILARAGIPDIASHILSNYYNQTRNEYYAQIQTATNSRSLTQFIYYALLGFRDGLQNVLRLVQHNQLQTAWHAHVYAVFSKFRDEKKARKSVFKRKRDMVLSMPLAKPMKSEDIPLNNMSVARAYAEHTERTLRRDLKELENLGLLLKVDNDTYMTNHRILHLQLARKIEDAHTSLMST